MFSLYFSLITCSLVCSKPGDGQRFVAIYQTGFTQYNVSISTHACTPIFKQLKICIRIKMMVLFILISS